MANDSECFRVFDVDFSKEILEIFQNIRSITEEIYRYLVLVLGPINILRTLFSASILIRKELRNPFNSILLIMCIELAVMIIIKVARAYCKLHLRCTVDDLSYSFAMHGLIDYHAYVIIRSHITYLAAILSFLRYRALRITTKKEASFTQVVIFSAISLTVIIAANIPRYKVIVVDEYPLTMICPVEDERQENATVPWMIWSGEALADGCLLHAQLDMNRTVKRTKTFEDSHRTTRMIIAVAVITLVSELPPEGIWMVSQLIATSCNLIVYLIMSKKFRQEALNTICFWKPQKQTSPHVASSVSIMITRY